jgi:hypothetical protein
MGITPTANEQTVGKAAWVDRFLAALSNEKTPLSVEQAALLGEQAWKAGHDRDPVDVARLVEAPVPGRMPMGLWAELFAIRMERLGAKQGRMGLVDWAYELYPDRHDALPAQVAEEEYEAMNAHPH